VSEDPGAKREKVLLGRVSGAHGIKGWVKIHSDTEPRDAIFDYQPWLVGPDEITTRVLSGRQQGKYLVAELKGISDRNAAEDLAGSDIAVYREQLPDLPQDHYYWADLTGLKVINQEGREFGRIKELIATGANDVMVVSGERDRLIPFVRGRYIRDVDLDAGCVTVDWDPDF